MFLGQVSGHTWSTKKTENLQGHRFLQVRVLDIFLLPTANVKTVVDTLGAGPGETVLCVGGSASRRWLGNNDRSFDNAVIGIVDNIDLDPREIEQLFSEQSNKKSLPLTTPER